MRVKYIYCPECFENKPDDVSPQDYSRMSIGATDLGDLVIQCNRHEFTTVIKNNDVALELFKLGSKPCGCGGDHEKETCH